MAKLNELADRKWLKGIGYPTEISEFDKDDILAQFVHNSSDLSFGQAHRWNVFQCCNNIK